VLADEDDFSRGDALEIAERWVLASWILTLITDYI
jgi:hypothetical protein